MKRYATILFLLLAVVCVATGVVAGIRRSTQMPVRFNTRGLSENAINIITPVDPSFPELVKKHFKNRSPGNLPPLSVFIENSSNRLVLAYALTWEVVDAEGKTITSRTVGYSEPGGLMGAEIPKGVVHTTAIEPGTVRCFTVDSQIEDEGAGAERTSGAFQVRASKETASAVRAMVASQKSEEAANVVRAMWADQLSRASDVTVSLDGVIFEDGIFVGPNNTGFFERMQAMVNAKVDLLREIEVAGEQNTLDQTLDSINAQSQEPDVVFGSNVSADDWYRYFRKLYASEINDLHRAHGKENMVRYFVKSFSKARPKLKRK
jgi:hypothetical protein